LGLGISQWDKTDLGEYLSRCYLCFCNFLYNVLYVYLLFVVVDEESEGSWKGWISGVLQEDI
jgi:hypothetical protein